MIAGGKYTTYRVMAADAVDAAVRELPQRVPASCTEDVPLVGADGYHGLWNARALLAEQTGLRQAVVEHLLKRYGSLLPEVLGVAEGRPELLEPLAGAPEYLQVEIVYAASHEGALHLDDLLARRTRISIETWDRGLSAAPEVGRAWSPPCSAGTPPTSTARSSTTGCGSPPSGSPSPSPTTSPPTPPGSAPPTSGCRAP